MSPGLLLLLSAGASVAVLVFAPACAAPVAVRPAIASADRDLADRQP